MSDPSKYRSTEIKDIAKAMVKVQSELKTAYKSKNNPHFKSKYSDYEDIVEVSRSSLTKNGLYIVHQVIPQGDIDSVYTMLIHEESGQWFASEISIPTKDDSNMQQKKSAFTYAKRQAYEGLVGIVCSDEDDDGEAATEPLREAKHKTPTTNQEEFISREQYVKLTALLIEIPQEERRDMHDKILEALHIDDLVNMKVKDFSMCLKGLIKFRDSFQD
jgi:ERF superfamily